MSIKINIHRSQRHFTNGKETVEVKGNTVGQCLNDLAQQFPGIEAKLLNKNGKLFSHIDVFVNLESSYPEELTKPVKDGDELSITLMIGGG